MARVAQLPAQGDTVGGQYVLGPIVGRGATGVVYEARQTSLNRSVALKMLLPKLLGADGIQERFKREARLASSLTHPNSVAVYAYGVYGEAPGVLGLPYIAMEFLEGEDLHDFLDREGPLPVEVVVDILRQALESLAEAHSKGIVHRDLKPENLYLCKGPSGERVVKVLDFGIAKALTGEWGSLTRRLTQTGMMCGTPEYMAPEQATGQKDITASVDVYAIGCIGYQMLTGAPPFKAPSPFAVALKHLSQPVPPLPGGIRDGEIGDIIHRALGKKPEMRFTDATDFLATLNERLPTSPQHQSGPGLPAGGPPPEVASSHSQPIETLVEPWGDDEATIDNGRRDDPFGGFDDSLHTLDEFGSSDVDALLDAVTDQTEDFPASHRPAPVIPQRAKPGGTRLGIPALGSIVRSDVDSEIDTGTFEADLIAALDAGAIDFDQFDEDDEEEATAMVSSAVVDQAQAALASSGRKASRLANGGSGPTSIKRPTLTKLKAAAEKLHAARSNRQATASIVADVMDTAGAHDVAGVADSGESTENFVSDVGDATEDLFINGAQHRPHMEDSDDEDESTMMLDQPMPTLTSSKPFMEDDEDDEDESTMMLDQPVDLAALAMAAQPALQDEGKEDEGESTMMLDQPVDLAALAVAAGPTAQHEENESTMMLDQPVDVQSVPTHEPDAEEDEDEDESTMMLDQPLDQFMADALAVGGDTEDREAMLDTEQVGADGAPSSPHPVSTDEDSEDDEDEPTTMIRSADYFDGQASADSTPPASVTPPLSTAKLAYVTAPASQPVTVPKDPPQSGSEIYAGTHKHLGPEGVEPTMSNAIGRGTGSHEVAGSRQGEAERLRLPRRPIVPRAVPASSSHTPVPSGGPRTPAPSSVDASPHRAVGVQPTPGPTDLPRKAPVPSPSPIATGPSAASAPVSATPRAAQPKAQRQAPAPDGMQLDKSNPTEATPNGSAGPGSPAPRNMPRPAESDLHPNNPAPPAVIPHPRKSAPAQPALVEAKVMPELSPTRREASTRFLRIVLGALVFLIVALAVALAVVFISPQMH